MATIRFPSLRAPAAALALSLAALPAAHAQTWEPTKPIEFVVPAGTAASSAGISAGAGGVPVP
jgi:hypothetical protein